MNGFNERIISTVDSAGVLSLLCQSSEYGRYVMITSSGGTEISLNMYINGSHENRKTQHCCRTMSLLQDLSDKMSIQTLLRANSSRSTYKQLCSKSTQGNFIKTEFK